ncbi:MAG TPA: ComEA family DNA-binding protein [Myxococcota bacterium]|nr:ComEA family DNA-binding protein [Myxococcota bacterium]HQK51976.1 ComEA family DNA-binding protein [Myxococcota bacterium]
MHIGRSSWVLVWLLGLGIPGASAQPVTEGPLEVSAPTQEVRRSGEEAGPDRIAVNRANAEQLMRLPGIGPKKAQALIEARERRPFRRPSDLRRVKGFGPKTILRLAPRLSFE